LATGIKRINESYKDFDLKPGFDVNESYISIALPLKKEIELTKNERTVLESINENIGYIRAEPETTTSLKKDTLIRILNSLISNSLIVKSGKTFNFIYSKKQ
jgi:ATP-dependent DNA helicase RecG